MKKIIALCAIIPFFAFGCNYDNDNKKDISNKNDTSIIAPVKADTIIAPVKADSIKDNKSECYDTIKRFLAWYKVNFNEIDAIQFIDLVGEDTTAQYRVNFKNVANYFSKLRSSGYFSEKYFQSRLKDLKDVDNKLLKNKQNDGPVERFEYDPILFTQEPEAVFEKLNSLKLQEVKTGIIKLVSLENNVLFNTEEQGGKCLINAINFSKK